VKLRTGWSRGPAFRRLRVPARLSSCRSLAPRRCHSPSTCAALNARRRPPVPHRPHTWQRLSVGRNRDRGRLCRRADEVFRTGKWCPRSPHGRRGPCAGSAWSACAPSWLSASRFHIERRNPRESIEVVGGYGRTCELVRRARHPCARARSAAPRSPRPRGSTKHGLAALRAARAPCVAGPWWRPENAARSAPLGGIARPAPRVRTRRAMRAGPRDAARRAGPGSRPSEQPTSTGRRAWIHRATARCRPGLDEHCQLIGGRPQGPPIFSHEREGFRHAMRRSRHSTCQLSRAVIIALSGCAVADSESPPRAAAPRTCSAASTGREQVSGRGRESAGGLWPRPRSLKDAALDERAVFAATERAEPVAAVEPEAAAEPVRFRADHDAPSHGGAGG
jgi:hypothetical protein